MADAVGFVVLEQSFSPEATGLQGLAPHSESLCSDFRHRGAISLALWLQPGDKDSRLLLKPFLTVYRQAKPLKRFLRLVCAPGTGLKPWC